MPFVVFCVLFIPSLIFLSRYFNVLLKLVAVFIQSDKLRWTSCMTAFNIHNELKYHWIWKISAFDIFENISIKVISPVPLILLSKPCQCCLFFRINFSFLIAEQAKLPLSRWKYTRKGRLEGDNDGLYPCHGPLRFITSHSRFALASTMRKTKHLRRRLKLPFLYKSVLSVVSVN